MLTNEPYQLDNEDRLLQSLSEQQQQEVVIAYDESEDEANLISLSAIKSKFNKWSL